MQVLCTPDANHEFASQRGKRAARRSNIASAGNRDNNGNRGATLSGKNVIPPTRSGKKGRKADVAAADNRQGSARKSASTAQQPAQRQRKLANNAADTRANTGRKRTNAFRAAR